MFRSPQKRLPPRQSRWLGLAAAVLVAQCMLVPAARGGDFEREPINYLTEEVQDPVAQLADRIRNGSADLNYDEDFGYLPAVLDALKVPTSSQTLVFSKTSLQLHRISPRRPRALYFNDDVYVGYCQNGDVLEFAATDAKQGAIFYTLKQSEEGQPDFVRDRGNCLSCHASSRTQGVPGYLVRSVFSDAAGRPKLGSGTYLTDHTSDFEKRWGGWYVTGDHGSMRHMGNTICEGDEYTFDRDSGANCQSLDAYIRPHDYLTPHSDIVALMVLEHQTQMHNAIASANYETRQALHQSYQMNELLERPKDYISESAERRIAAASDRVLEYLLMVDEFPMTSPVKGSSEFTQDFARDSVRDSRDRSLRDFDLKTRVFRYPCSYLIYSPAFDALPDKVREQVMAKLRTILEGRDDNPDYKHLTPTLRREILEILDETKPEFSASSSQSSTS